MNENELERLLHKLTPADPGAALDARIAHVLSQTSATTRLPLADRFLLAAISSGLIAACLIVFLVASDPTHTAPPPAQQAARLPPPVEQQRLFAQLLRDADLQP